MLYVLNKKRQLIMSRNRIIVLLSEVECEISVVVIKSLRHINVSMHPCIFLTIMKASAEMPEICYSGSKY
jgi:hypothetical protein